jgi:hypothetical protein
MFYIAHFINDFIFSFGFTAAVGVEHDGASQGHQRPERAGQAYAHHMIFLTAGSLI